MADIDRRLRGKGYPETVDIHNTKHYEDAVIKFVEKLIAAELSAAKAISDKKEDTRFSQYKKWIENHQVTSLILILAFLISTLSGIFKFGENVYAFIFPAPNIKFEADLKRLALTGCIFFKPDSSVPAVDLPIIVDSYKQFWRDKNIAYQSILVSGYTYSRGSQEYNMAYGERRARAAAEYVVKMARISDHYSYETISYGEEKGIDRVGEYECGAIVEIK